MKNITLLFVLLGMVSLGLAQQQTSLAERLGYPKDTKLLIIHADDLAVSHAQNQASFKAMKDSSVTSASIMVPCPWLTEVADYAKANPNHDLGLHLTVTSEWELYKWGPTASRDQVSTLVNAEGYFYDNCADLAKHAKVEEVERELRAQIEKAKAMGIEPTHLDSHMGCLFFSNPAIFAIYLKLGKEYGIPTMMNQQMVGIIQQTPEQFKGVYDDKTIVIDQIFTASEEDYKNGMQQYYEKTLHNLPPGVNELIIHTAYDNAEMQGITIDHPSWGAAWRQTDFNFFTSETCRKILKEENIHLVTWREIGKLLKQN